MERKNGLELIQCCEKLDIPPIFIIVSGYDTFEYAQKAVELGAFRYLLKPLVDHEVQKAMQQVLVKIGSQKKNHGEGITDMLPEATTFEHIIEYLRLHRTEKISLNDLADKFYLNRTYICDLFRKHTGTTFTQIMNELKVQHACGLLKNTNQSVGDIAQSIGFSDYRYFARIFRNITGKTPSEYRLYIRAGGDKSDYDIKGTALS